MLQAGKYILCTTEEFLEEGKKEAGDVVFGVFGQEMLSASVLLPPKMAPREAKKRIRTRLSQDEALREVPVFAYTASGKAAHVFFTPRIPEKARSDFKVSYAPGPAILEYATEIIAGSGTLYLINLQDSKNSVVLCFIHGGKEALTRVINPAHFEDFRHEVTETVRQIKREHSSADFRVASMGFPSGDSDPLNGFFDEPHCEVELEKFSAQLPAHAYFHAPRQYPFKTAALVVTGFAAMYCAFTFSINAANLSMAIVEKSRLEKSLSQIQGDVAERKSLISAYRGYAPLVSWDDFFGSFALVSEIVTQYPFTFSAVRLEDRQIKIEGRFWALEPESVRSDVAECQRRFSFGVRLLANDPTPQKEGDWFYQGVKIEGEVLDHAQRNRLKNNLLGSQPQGMESRHGSEPDVSGSSLLGQVSLRPERADAKLGQGLKDTIFGSVKKAAGFALQLFASAGNLGLGVAHANSLPDTTELAGQDNPELHERIEHLRQQLDLERPQTPVHGGSSLPAAKSAHPVSEDPGAGSDSSAPRSSDHGHRESQGVEDPLFEGGPNENPDLQIEILKKQYAEIKKEKQDIELKMKELNSQREELRKSLTQYNPKGYYLVSTTPDCAVLSDDSGHHFFVDVGENFLYENELFTLENVRAGQRATFVGEKNHLGMQSKLVFLFGKGSRPNAGAKSVLLSSAKAKEEGQEEDPVAVNKPAPAKKVAASKAKKALTTIQPPNPVQIDTMPPYDPKRPAGAGLPEGFALPEK